MLMGTSGAIEAQESRGQGELVQSDVLPVKFMGPSPFELIKSKGGKILGPVPDDSIFQYVQLPAGWKKVPTEHSMWTNLVDEAGREVANIFYKAAFYDRSAFIRLV